MATDSLFTRILARFRAGLPARSTGGVSPPQLTAAMRSEIARQVALTVAETDNTFIIGARAATTANWRDRFDYKRDEILLDALLVWRDNPLARRIVGLTTQYVVGGGLVPICKHPETARFLTTFWQHRLNRMTVRSIEWCDELTRSGNLFILVSTDAAGMSYVRAISASDIQKIDHAPNDVEQPTLFWPKASMDHPDPPPYPAYDPDNDGRNESGEFQPVMLHYAVNRPVGAQWGEPDLGPLLRWLTRYDGFLEDRVRLNRHRQSFTYRLKGKFNSEAERNRRQAEVNLHPPTPGSVLVTDDSEDWDVISPKLESPDAERDGLALKKLIAAGAGVPLHFLAEPESATRTTAEASGGPTYRYYEQRQLTFLTLLVDILALARQRRTLAGGRLSRTAEITVKGGDISARDNAALSMAASQIIASFTDLRDRGLIDDAELMRITYRFAGELVDVEELLARGAKAPPPRLPAVAAKPKSTAAPKPDLTDPAQDPAISEELSHGRNGRN